MNDSLRLEIESVAFSAVPNECCGYIIQNYATGGLEVVPSANLAAQPTEAALFSPLDTQSAILRGFVVATYHSHPFGSESPSPQDLAACDELDIPFYIFCCETKGWYHLRPSDAPPVPLIGREFAFGLFDCYGLVRDYFKMQHGVQLNTYACRDDFWEKGQNLFLDHFVQEGFHVVEDEVRVGDCFLMCVKSPKHLPNHAAVYVGCGQILHHVQSRLSCQAPLTGLWSRCIHSRVRHSSLCLPQSTSTAA